ncbi:MAG: hypothetical protein RBU21_21975 [FCB group bacterium]|jgi:hypothetical protein|nr:hypothetical protein [FCB group bacterium]
MRVLVLAAVLGGLLNPGFDPAQWPGKMPQTPRVNALAKELREAVRACDSARIEAVKAKLVTEMGAYAGTPEEKPEYGASIDPSTPDLAKVETVWRETLERLRTHHLWADAAPRDAQFQTGNRLRVPLREARAYLFSYEAGLEPKDQNLAAAKEGFEYILGAQASTGVFGFPYDPKGGGLKKQAVAVVDAAKARGLNVVENGWVIDDLGDGGLNFDNGTCGIGLLDAYRVLRDERYLDAAKRAGDWTIGRPLVLNWNYNAFSGWLLARLYCVTGEQRYLDEAKRIFTCGVLPGQMDNGRWFDQHNAKIQYHSILATTLIDYTLALKKAQDPLAAEVEKKTKLALDNLSEQITTFGSSDPTGLLSLEALCMGLEAFGPTEQWQKAVNVDVNCLCNEFAPRLAARDMPVPDPIAEYIRYRRWADTP